MPRRESGHDQRCRACMVRFQTTITVRAIGPFRLRLPGVAPRRGGETAVTIGSYHKSRLVLLSGSARCRGRIPRLRRGRYTGSMPKRLGSQNISGLYVLVRCALEGFRALDLKQYRVHEDLFQEDMAKWEKGAGRTCTSTSLEKWMRWFQVITGGE